MLSPSSLKEVPQYPITSSVAVGAIIVTVMWWTGHDINALLLDYHVWNNGELWRALTCTLPHVNFFHLAFNLYWLWAFGTLVERVYGHLKCAGIYLLLAAGSMLAEFAVLDGGVGLSGLGYGLWGMIMMLERRDPRFAGAVDRQTNRTFIIWFFLCIVLTVTNVMPVANIAHGVGAVMGILLGCAIGGDRVLKWKCSLGLVVIFSLSLLGSTILWPWVNLSSLAEVEIERAGLADLDHDDYPHAIKLLNLAAHKKNAPARVWYNLGIAYDRAGQYKDALTAYEQAAQLPDADIQIRQASQHLKEYFNPGQTNQ